MDDFGDNNIMVLCVLKGGYKFCADLVEFIKVLGRNSNKYLETRVEFIRLKSYLVGVLTRCHTQWTRFRAFEHYCRSDINCQTCRICFSHELQLPLFESSQESLLQVIHSFINVKKKKKEECKTKAPLNNLFESFLSLRPLCSVEMISQSFDKSFIEGKCHFFLISSLLSARISCISHIYTPVDWISFESWSDGLTSYQ